MRYQREVLVLLLVAAACSEGPIGPADAAPCADDTGIVSVTVSDAAQPVMAWDPSCAVAMVLIEEEASDQWLVSTDEALWTDPSAANLIAPPVTYGVVPAGAEQTGPPATLVPGVTYEVILYRILPAGSTATCVQRFEQMCLMAVHAFVR